MAQANKAQESYDEMMKLMETYLIDKKADMMMMGAFYETPGEERVKIIWRAIKEWLHLARMHNLSPYYYYEYLNPHIEACDELLDKIEMDEIPEYAVELFKLWVSLPEIEEPSHH